MLDNLWMTVLDMTKAASIVIGCVIIVRFLFKRMPKIFSYVLWSLVLFRLLCPLSIEAPISLMPSITPTSEAYTLDDSISFWGASEAAYDAIGDAANGGLGIQHIPATEQDKNGNVPYVTSLWWEVWILIGQYIWLFGIAAMLIRSAVSYYKLKRSLIGAMPLHQNIFLSDYIPSPFVIGLFRPKIYLPSALSEKEQSYIILHERHHIKRLDPMIKALAFLALCLHWFNPLVWLAFSLFVKDMEMSCDEAVIRKIGPEIRADYGTSLLNLGTKHKVFMGTPLAFGEGDLKTRIQNLTRWKKPARWNFVTAGTIFIILTVCLLTSPVTLRDTLKLIDVHQNDALHSVSATFDAALGPEVQHASLIVETWGDGRCISKSAPVSLTRWDKELNLAMAIRYEESTAVGVEIAIDTDQSGGFLLTYFPFPNDLSMRGWSFSSYKLNEKIDIKPDDNRVLAAMAFDGGKGIRVFDMPTLGETDYLGNATYMVVIRADFNG